MNKEQEFLSKLADLIDEYKVGFEVNYDVSYYNDISSYFDIDFKDVPCKTITFNKTYIDSGDIRDKIKEL